MSRPLLIVTASLAALLVRPPACVSLPAPAPLRFVAPTPAEGTLVVSGTVGVRLDAACALDTGTLAVSLNGNPIAQGQFLPFSSCTDGRMASQTVTVGLALPEGAIVSAPTVLGAGGTATFSGMGNGDDLRWNFDGGAAPASGPSAVATFAPAGRFTVRLRATRAEILSASALDSGDLVTAERTFDGGDPTPDARELTVLMPAGVDFVNYESSHVHPLVLSADGTQLYAVNTPENRLAIFDVGVGGALVFAADVPVGVDPVSAAVRPGTGEVWVANHLSDTVSVVDVAARKLTATIACGDEPTDVVFAGGRAFVSLAGREDRVKVYDAGTREELARVDIFGDDPRALAVSADGTQVYVAVLESGNRTTTLFRELVSAGGGLPPPSPPRDPGLGPAPDVGLIVQFDPVTGRWEDETGGDWSAFVDFTLPDQDVFVIDAAAAAPSVIGTVSGVGTILFDVAVRPGTGDLWVPNTDARNLVRFEPNLRGHLVGTRVSIVDPATGAVAPVDLNPHIDYAVTPGPAAEIALSLAHPGDGEFSADGSTYYLTAFGSGKVAVLDAAAVVTDRIVVGGGPSGVALNEAASRLYVLNRFDNTVSIVDTGTNTEVGVVGVAGPSAFDPSPDVIKNGRKFLYDGRLTSGHGDIACATCHVFGNFDNLAWDLGDPQGQFVAYGSAPWISFFPLGPSTAGFDPMKGPMTTQTLRGLKGLEPFHWRGDRRDFQSFNPAFVSLMGKDEQLSAADMDAYIDFIMTVSFPPNPYRNLDDTLPASIAVPLQSGGGATANGNPQVGAAIFTDELADAGVFTCNQCHALPTGTTTTLFNGAAEGETQDFKIPHLRNMYEKVGFEVIRPGVLGGGAGNIGLTAQKAGFGFLHDGSVSLTEFLAAGVFTLNGQQERDMFAFMLAFPAESAPAVGAQVTVDASSKNDPGAALAITTLELQAEAGGCDLIAKGVIGGVTKGYLYDPGTDLFVPDSLLEIPVGESVLRGSMAGGDVLTYTGVPPGAGGRLGIDRDRDTWLDRTEAALGTDPADPNSNPWQF